MPRRTPANYLEVRLHPPRLGNEIAAALIALAKDADTPYAPTRPPQCDINIIHADGKVTTNVHARGTDDKPLKNNNVYDRLGLNVTGHQNRNPKLAAGKIEAAIPKLLVTLSANLQEKLVDLEPNHRGLLTSDQRKVRFYPDNSQATAGYFLTLHPDEFK